MPTAANIAAPEAPIGPASIQWHPRLRESATAASEPKGLGGAGKTQIALEAVFRVRAKHKDCHVFWVPAVDTATFGNAYHEIGQKLAIEGPVDDKADIKSLVKEASTQTDQEWLLVINNADDMGLLFGSTGLCDYLPFSRRGSILFMARNHEVVARLDIPLRSIIKLEELARPEACDEAESMISLETYSRVLWSNSPETLSAVACLAAVLQARGTYDEAEAE
ncbi:hypothetical protein QBC46DRAFT_346880 [Diplogelasinospora grovesii]|uniref:NB-ARC domain-containing protein n=1 Tax=Diplogelasinospora grovesii TaxID=303347 RepID=A0AAN6RZS5_9PEZI|nr:hypothetical protein QBC46DRAFT_346880 [Diplogelasinospora grovesii]